MKLFLSCAIIVAACIPTTLMPSAQSSTWQPRASVITSVFKGDVFIKGYLEDITHQTSFDLCEFIVINANSPGNEDAIIQEYATKHPNIVYIKLDRDPGLYAVWNFAISKARAPYITNWNLDDRRAPYALALQTFTLDTNPQIDLVYADFFVSYSANETFDQCDKRARCQVREFAPENLDACLPGPAPMWRKNLHERFGFFCDWFTSAGDWHFWNLIVAQGARFKKIPTPYCTYFMNPQGISTTPDPVKAAIRAKEEELVVRSFRHLWAKGTKLPAQQTNEAAHA